MQWGAHKQMRAFFVMKRAGTTVIYTATTLIESFDIALLQKCRLWQHQ